MQTLLPDQYEDLQYVARVLPHQYAPIAGAFCGYVLNVNVVTRAHRDEHGTLLCLCFSLGDWVGGQLVIKELRLVFDNKPGEVIVFDSAYLTHFNMHYKGYCMSLVMQTKELLGYQPSELADISQKLGLTNAQRFMPPDDKSKPTEDPGQDTVCPSQWS